MTQPIIKWFEGTNAAINEVTNKVDFGRVDADTDSPSKTFYIWNNHNGADDVSKMEEVTYTTRDRTGGTGDTLGNIVEAVRDNWFNVRVDSLGEVAFTTVGKVGNKFVGTNGNTTNPNAATAVTWTISANYSLNDYIKPTVPNGFIYKVTKDGQAAGAQPTWLTVEGALITDGTVEYVAIEIDKTAGTHEILGVTNSVLADGTNAVNSGANFVKLTVFADVPINASAGKNLLLQRISYRYV